jgi:UDP-N-acetylmuramyl pentapeptide phosphotransferase/UDP-N-acetylglucosamine-1-phosphate transferase
MWAARENIFPLWVAIIIFSPFIVDATLTLFLRLFRKEKIWKAHKNHYYQRLVQLGWGHKRTVLWEYLLMLMCCASAWLAVRLAITYQWIILLSWTIVYILLIVFIHQLEARHRMIEK